MIGLTLSENQYAHCVAEFDKMDSPRRKEVRIQGWEETIRRAQPINTSCR